MTSVDGAPDRAHSEPCDEVAACLRRGEPLDPASRAHAEECDLCRELVLAARHLPSRDGHDVNHEEREALLGRARASIEREDRTLRGTLVGQRTPLRVGLTLSAFGLVLLLVGWLAARPDLVAYPAGRLALSLGSLVSLVIAAAVIALRPSSGRRPRHEAWLMALVLLVPVVLALLPEAETGFAASHADEGPELFPRALRCLVGGVFFALPMLGALLYLSRVTWRSRVFWAAAAAGLSGAAALELHCPLVGHAHLLLGHASVAFAMVTVVFAFASLGKPEAQRLRR